MSTITKTARAALVVAILALATAGAAFADANRPSDANSPATHPDPGQIFSVTGPSTHHPDPGRIVEYEASSSSGTSTHHPDPGHIVEQGVSSSFGTSRITRARPNGVGCYPRCYL